jgi:hypothetical protein
MGLFSSSKSSATNNTTNNDLRVVADGGSIGVSGSGNAINVLDGGAISRTFDSLDLINKTNASTYGDMLSLMGSLFTKTSDALSTNAAQTQANVLEAYRNASSDAGQTIDNRTIIVLALAGAVVVYFMSRR